MDRLMSDQAAVALFDRRLVEIEACMKHEKAVRAGRALWLSVIVAACSTVAGGVLGAIVAHFWR